MKKATMVFLALMLVLSIGQATFAKGSINLGLSFDKILDSDGPYGMSIKLDGNYYFTQNFSLAADFNVDLFFDEGDLLDTYNISLFARYDLLKTSASTIGLQFGLTDNIIREFEDQNVLMFGPGAYANFRIGSKTSIYADVKLPIGAFVIQSGFVPIYFFNLSLGATYEVTSKINIGIEANVNNYWLNPLFPDFSIGVKLGYNF